MLDKEIILNKKITKSYFIIFFLTLMIVSIIILLFFPYKSYYQTNAIVTQDNNKYLLKIKTDLSSLKVISNCNFLTMDDNEYYYQIYKIDNYLLNQDDKNYLNVYLKLNLDKKYQINNYVLPIKVEKETKRIINYLVDSD